MQHQAPAVVRLIALLTLPAAVTGALIFVTLFTEFSYRSTSQQTHFGRATASQLAHYIAPYVLENNLLSLNIVVSELASDEYIQFVAIYDESDRLIAQAGRESGGTLSFSTEITFQDSVIGFARVAVVSESPPNGNWALILLVIIIPLVLLASRNPAAFAQWLYPEAQAADDEPGLDELDETAALPPLEDDGAETCECILVIRVRPAHHMERQFERLFNAAEIYGGIVEQTTPEELVVHFDDVDAMYRAASTGLLVRALCELLPGNIKFGGTLDVLTGEAEKIRKSASYLASIADGDLLIARGEDLLRDRVLLQTFHHSLIDSKDLCRVTGLTNPELINEQAKQLL